MTDEMALEANESENNKDHRETINENNSEENLETGGENVAEADVKSEVIPSKILEQLPEEQRKKVLRAFHRVERRASFFRGPLPPPIILKEYEAILPGSANRIVTMAEKQQDHRMELEHAVIHSDIVMERLGLAAGFILAVILIIGSIWLVSKGKELTGLSVLVGAIASLVGIFIFGQRQRQRELDERKQVLEEGPKKST